MNAMRLFFVHSGAVAILSFVFVYNVQQLGRWSLSELCDGYRGIPRSRCASAGPTGKVLLLPADVNAPLICVATGTGIAPFRSFWRRCFMENVPSYKFTGLFWLFMGVANSDAKLYDEELQVHWIATTSCLYFMGSISFQAHLFI